MNPLLKIPVILACMSCTMIPIEEMIESDMLPHDFELSELEGEYHPAAEALDKLKYRYTREEMALLRGSRIVIENDSTYGFDIPAVSLHECIIRSGRAKLIVSGLGHSKFRFIDHPTCRYPNMKFRMLDGRKSILINLSMDPDDWEYYEYESVSSTQDFE